MIADEPTGNLDSENADGVYKLIRNLHNDLKMTFILVTHDAIKPHIGDRIITLSDGKIIKDIIIEE